MTDSGRKSGALRYIILVLGVLAAIAGGVVAWLEAGPANRPKAVLVGMDALTWTFLDPMMESGKLPNLKALKERGSYGELKTLKSTYISASIWTTILTGKHPTHHGIKGWYSMRGFPVNSTNRKTKYLPQYISDNGVVPASVGFMATWPAEEVEGFIVSDLASYGRFKDQNEKTNKTINDYSYLKKIERVTWPPELVNEILEVMKNPDEVPREIYETVLPMTDEQWEEFRKIDRVSRENELSLLKFSVVTDYNFHRAGLEIIEDHGPHVYMVYFQGVDIVEHFFWKYHEPEFFKDYVTPRGRARFGGVIENYYRLMDRFLGEILEAADPDALVMVCSDHGMERVDYMGQDGPHSGQHRVNKPAGAILMAGPGVKKNNRLEAPVVYDIAPTMLYFLGLPIGSDMDGKPLLGAAEEGFAAGNPMKAIETYDVNFEYKDEKPSPLDGEIKERLRAIGYID